MNILKNLPKLCILQTSVKSGFSFPLSLELDFFVISIPTESLCLIQFLTRYLRSNWRTTFSCKILLSLYFCMALVSQSRVQPFQSFWWRNKAFHSLWFDSIPNSASPSLCLSKKVRKYIFLCRRTIIHDSLLEIWGLSSA